MKIREKVTNRHSDPRTLSEKPSNLHTPTVSFVTSLDSSIRNLVIEKWHRPVTELKSMSFDKFDGGAARVCFDAKKFPVAGILKSAENPANIRLTRCVMFWCAVN